MWCAGEHPCSTDLMDLMVCVPDSVPETLTSVRDGIAPPGPPLSGATARLALKTYW